MGMLEYFEKTYAKYFVSLSDKEAYLKRIGLGSSDILITKEWLDRLQFAHMCSVPFENLDLYDYDGNVDFGTEEMFDKVVTRWRGGYCFELNALFMSLLEAIGFEVYPVGVRIVMGMEGSSFVPTISHRASIVTIGGKRYYTDVGFGMLTAPGASICIDDYGEQDVMGDIYTVRDRPYNNKMIVRHAGNGPTEMFMFSSDPFNVVDFIAFNVAIQIKGFRDKRIANLRTLHGSMSIDGDIFRRTENGRVTETPLRSAEDAYRVLSNEYGMILLRPLKDLAVKPEAQL